MFKKYRLLLFMLLLSLNFASHAQNNQTVEGVISNDIPYKAQALTVSETGQSLEVNLVAQDGDLDTLLYLLDSAGNIIAENDDRVRGDTNSYLLYPQIPVGQYTIIATRYNISSGRSSGSYEMAISLSKPELVGDYAVSAEALLAAGFPDAPVQAAAEWTILAYYGGDTDLERGVLNDFNEFELAGGSDASVRVIALIDRTPGFTDIDEDWQNPRLYEISADVTGDEGINFPPTPDSVALADLPELDMSNGESLAQFLVWSIQHYPAKRYAVAFASHGAGWQGLIQDDSAEGHLLSIPELEQAFQLAREIANVEQFDILINDACLMSSIEYHDAMSEFFPLSFASPEVVVDPALDMTLFTDFLKANPDADLEEIGESLVDAYIGRDIQAIEANFTAFLTHSVTNLAEFATVTQAVNDFATLINAQPEVYSVTLGAARANAYTYSTFLNDSSRIDLGSLMNQVIEISDDTSLESSAQAVLDALTAVRLYADGGERVADRISYYNIYFPASSADYRTDYLLESPLTEWGLMLRNFYRVMTPKPWEYDLSEASPTSSAEVPQVVSFHEPIVPQVSLSSVYPAVGSVLRPFNIQAEVVGRNIAQATYFVDRQMSADHYERLASFTILTANFHEDGTFDLVNDWRSGVDLITLVDDNYLPVISDGTTSSNEYVIVNEDVASLEGRYREADSETWRDATVIFDYAIEDALNQSVGYVQQVMGLAADSNAVAPIQISAGSEFQAYRYEVTSDGRTVRTEGTTYQWTEQGLTISVAPAPTGDYQIGVEVATYGGIKGSDTIQVSINNDDLEAGKQGYVNVTLGIDTLFPATWTKMEYLPEADIYVTSPYDGTQAFLLIPMYEGTDDLSAIATAFLGSQFGGALLTEPSYTTINGHDALTFLYQSGMFDLSWEATAYVLYNPVSRSELVLSFLGGGEAATEQIAIMNQIIADTRLVEVGNTRRWSYEATDSVGNIELPVPLDWAIDQASEGVTFYYPPSSTNDENTFVAVFSQVLETDASLETVLAAIEQVALNDWIGLNESYEIQSRQSYYGSYTTWTAILYDAVSQEANLTGRVYTAVFESPQGIQVIAIWAETKADNLDFIYNVLEPMVDGMQIVER